MSRRLTEERFSIACTNSVNKLTGFATGMKQTLSKTKNIVVKYLENKRNVDARKEARILLENQYKVDIFEGLSKIISQLSKYSSALPKYALIPRSIEVEVRTIVYFSDIYELEIKELGDLRKMFVGQFGNTVCVETYEEVIDQKLLKKYKGMMNINDEIVNSLVEALKPKNVQQTQSKQLDVPTTEPKTVTPKYNRSKRSYFPQYK